MSTKLPDIKVALSIDFLEAFSEIPKRQQAHVRRFLDGFRRNPTASSHNYEVIRDSRDPNLRSVRIDGTYRAIVLKPETGNVYAMLWVDHHDDAYAWARNRRVRIDVATGALQVVPVEVAAPEVVPEPRRHVTPPAEALAQAREDGQEEAAAPEGRAPLFKAHSDAVLLGFGLPEAFLPAVRAVTSEAALDALAGVLPAEAYEALTYLFAGFPPEEVREHLAGDARPTPPADPTDFAAAFANAQTLRRFVVVEDDAALAEILDAPLAKWRVFLHPSQRRLVEFARSGPVRVLGGAGTGKTVVAMHRAVHLATRVFTSPTDRILFTTFTRNLAADIGQQLGAICPAEARARIEVVHFDQWVRDFLARQGFPYTVVYNDMEPRPRCWEAALDLMPAGLGLSPAFLREEFDKVVVPQGVLTAADYFAAPRLGRGTALSRKERAAIWPVFEDYRRRLAEARAIEIGDAMREARLLLERQGDLLPYRAVVVDEAQDLGPQAFRLLRQIAGPERAHDMFIVGDAHQRIYGQPVVLSRCGVNVRGRSVTLKVNYRTTD
ncbi:MAG: UvrD-helicase domain-containing protein, partial [Candidatus Sericytochromatia bacterium]|nr:UvrD-helicase domain-containing protein [Candidatus Sericytochromatia bacterium]